jgi:hypothetical protein
MYCTQCGTLVSIDGKFCANCGSSISGTSTDKPTEVLTVSVTPTMPGVIWLYIAGVLLVGAYAAMLIPAIAGREISPLSGYSSMLWNSLFFYLWWKRRARKGWHGALIGSAMALFVFFAAAFISSYVRHGSGG